jgi:hypothetical protein
MITAGLSLAAVALLTYVWVLRGFFSALIHLICVVIAGAIAFAAWEPVSLLILSSAPTRGFLSGLADVAWALGLALPFAISLAILRAMVDGVLRANAACEPAFDFIGGGVCGFLAAIISVGIFVLSAGMLRNSPLHSTLVTYTNQAASPGSIQSQREFIRPYVDELTVAFYEKLSERAFRTPRPLARWRPNMESFPSALVMSFNEGKARNTARPGDLKFVGVYTVGDAQAGQPLDASIMADAWNATPQKAITLDGEQISSGHLVGVVINFQPGAREKDGQVFVGNSQVQLVVESADGETRKTLHPLAIVCQTDKTDIIEYARFRFDSPELFIASVGATSDAVMAFEFAVPSGHRPLAAYFKGARINLESTPAGGAFANAAERDDAIDGKTLFGVGAAGRELQAGDRLDWNPKRGVDTEVTGISFSFVLGFTIQKGNEDALQVSPGSRSGYEIIGGEAKLGKNSIGQANVDQNLRIGRFAVPSDSTLARVAVTGDAITSLLKPSAGDVDRTQPPQLIDADGRAFDCVGFVYEDTDKFHVRYTLESPLRSLTEAPTLSRSRGDQKLVLLFRLNRGVSVSKFVIGSKIIAEYEPPLKAG